MRSGGLCIGIQRTIVIGSDTFTIINVYDSAEQSAYKARRKAAGKNELSTLDSPMDFIANNTLGKIFLTGDFNARTKNLNHDIVHEEDEFAQGIHSEPSDSLRMSKDFFWIC